MTIEDMYDWLYRLKSELVVYMPKEWHDPMRCSIQDAITFSRKYQMLLAEYKKQLKADTVATLEDLKKKMKPIKECEQQIYGKEHWNFVGKCQDVIQDKINELKGEVEPEPKPKTGHWIRVDKDKLKCSKCDVIHFIAQYPQGKIVWCPNCGAKNESEDK